MIQSCIEPPCVCNVTSSSLQLSNWFTSDYHPRYKTTYWRKAGWKQEWITTAEKLVDESWARRRLAEASTQSPVSTVCVTFTGEDLHLTCFCQPATSASSIFDSIDNFGFDSGADVLDGYENSPPIRNVENPLRYWSNLVGQGDSLPDEALDFLSAPGTFLNICLSSTNVIDRRPSATSCDVEPAFSRGRLTVSRIRHSLSDESTRAATVLSSWAAVGLIPEAEVMQVFRDESKRPKPVKAASSVVVVDDGDAVMSTT